MINIIKTQLENKTNKQFIYYIGASKIILDPGKPVIINGDIFTRETRQEGNTEGLLVNVYNGNIDLTLMIDDTFVTKVERTSVTVLPKRSQDKLINKSKASEKEPAKEEPKKVEPVKEEPKKAEVKEEPKKAEVKEEPKKVEPAKEETVKVEVKEEASLDNVVVEDTKPRTKKAAKL
jgi:hypothetical protein